MLVRKKNGELRLCVDYRELNKITVRDNFPTPIIEDHLDRLKNKKIYSSLDLKNGFYHVRMAESSIKFTAFITPMGQFEFLRMPFGLTVFAKGTLFTSVYYESDIQRLNRER